MLFSVKKTARNLNDLVRNIGYRSLDYTPKGELNCVRPLGGDYPRFHLFIIEESNHLTFKLHLDQKKPSYPGAHAHSGDYDSETVQRERERIKEVLGQV